MIKERKERRRVGINQDIGVAAVGAFAVVAVGAMTMITNLLANRAKPTSPSSVPVSSNGEATGGVRHVLQNLGIVAKDIEVRDRTFELMLTQVSRQLTSMSEAQEATNGLLREMMLRQRNPDG